MKEMNDILENPKHLKKMAKSLDSLIKDNPDCHHFVTCFMGKKRDENGADHYFRKGWILPDSDKLPILFKRIPLHKGNPACEKERITACCL